MTERMKQTPKAVREAAVARVVAGEDAGEVAASLDVKRAKVARWCNEAGISLDTRRLIPEDKKEHAIELLVNGEKVGPVARQLDISARALSEMWRRHRDKHTVTSPIDLVMDRFIRGEYTHAHQRQVSAGG